MVDNFDNKFSIMLQLHAEDGSPSLPSSGEGGASGAVIPPPATTSPSAPTTTSASADNTAANNGGASENKVAEDSPKSAPQYKIDVDQRTGRRRVVTIGGDNDTGNAPQQSAEPEQAQPQETAQQPEPKQGQPKQQEQTQPQTPLFNMPDKGQTQQPQQPQAYKNAAELMQAIQSGTLDESKIPMELAFQYAAYKQQSERAAQQERQAALAAAQAQEQQAQPQEQREVSGEEARRVFYGRVEELAKGAALKDVGITEEQLVTAEYSDDEDIRRKAELYNTAVAWHRHNIMENVYKEQAEAQAARQAQQNLMGEISNKIIAFSKNEPAFNEINNIMGSRYQTMPYQKATKYAQAIAAYNNRTITAAQAQDLEDYYNTCRQEYYAKKHNLAVGINGNAPRVESSGSGAIQSGSQDSEAVPKAAFAQARSYKDQRKLIGQVIARMDARKRQQ